MSGATAWRLAKFVACQATGVPGLQGKWGGGVFHHIWVSLARARKHTWCCPSLALDAITQTHMPMAPSQCQTGWTICAGSWILSSAQAPSLGCCPGNSSSG